MRHPLSLLTLCLSALLWTGCFSSRQNIKGKNANELSSFSANSQNYSPSPSHARDSYEAYVLTYYPCAVEQMKRHRIPASITLAQGLLESGAGKSTLTRKSNNHFGIKAGKDWKGGHTSSMDNGRMCSFRAYPSARESYEDHSLFLVGRERYASLFRLATSDYKGWAYGLKKAGYAEDPAYPRKLIDLIERYELHKYDRYRINDIPSKGYSGEGKISSLSRDVFLAGGLLYVVAQTGDSFQSIARETGISRSKLVRYNDLYKSYQLKAGDIIYLEKKKSKAPKELRFHTTANNESLHSIAQKYGIRLKNLYKMNPAFQQYSALKVGDIIRLR